MNIAWRFLAASILGASVLVGGSAMAQPLPRTTGDDPGPSARGDEAPNVAREIPSDQASRLEEALERYREIERRGGWKTVPTDLVMGPGFTYDCERVARLERRLVAEGYLRYVSATPPPPPPLPTDGRKPPKARPEPPRPAPAMGLGGPCRYGSELTAAVRAFQADRKILGEGQVGKLTWNELNKPVSQIIDILERDVERWRNLSIDPSGTYLLVNIPFYEVIGYQHGRPSMRMQVIVGQPSWPTPRFSDELEYIVLNPDWGIPDKIAKQEYWPSARRDPKYLSRQGITANGGSLRQKPGPRNPLGRIKFVMPNQNDVYLHDTPEKRAFTAAVGALSHGCIRLSRPMDMADYLLRDDPEWSPSRVQAAIASGKTMQINLRRHMPVHIIYSTSRVNDEGRVEIRPDVYGMDKRAFAEGEEVRLNSGDESLDTWP